MQVATTEATIRAHEQTALRSKLPAYSVHMDAIRAVAAFLVLAGHARMLFFGEHEAHHAHATSDGAKIAGMGGQSVIVFFVLSGFLVGNSAWRAIRNSKWSWRKYLTQRMTRLWIVLIPALIFGGLLDHAGMHFFSANGGIYSSPAGQTMVDPDLPNSSTLAVLAGNTFFLQKIFFPSFGTNAALWSLANEFWYYMLIPLLLLFYAGQASRKARMLYGALALAILILVGHRIAAFFLIWLLGFVVSTLPMCIPPPLRRTMTTGAGLQFLSVIVFLRLHATSVPTAAGLTGISFAIFLYAIVHARQPIGSLLYQNIATTSSKFSYTLYLTHLPLLVFIVALINHPWHVWPKTPAYLSLAVLLVIVTYAYAWMMYLLFERNTDIVRGWISRLWAGDSPTSSFPADQSHVLRSPRNEKN